LTTPGCAGGLPIGHGLWGWRDVVGQEAEQTSSRPREVFYGQDGLLDGRRLALTAKVNRVSWEVTGDERPVELPDAGSVPMAIGPFEEA
jgi:hypothetical protein